MDKSARNDVIAAILVLGVAAVFGYATRNIYISPQDPGFSARDFPIMVLSLLVVLTLVLLVPSVVRLARTGWRVIEAGEATTLLRFLLPIIGFAFLYVWLNELFQYLGPTILAAGVTLAMFGNRGAVRLILVPVVAAITYYILFFGLLGLFETPGSVWEFNSQVFFRPLRDFLGFY